MNARLQKLYDIIERDRQLVDQFLIGVSNEKFNAAASGKWSINQIVSHLITAERLTLRYMEKKILGVNDLENSGIAEELKMFLLQISQRLPLKFKAPKFLIQNTILYPDIPAMKKDWGAARGEYHAFLEKISEENVNRKIYKHVRAGMLNVGHSIKFAHEHFVHHWPQVKRLL